MTSNNPIHPRETVGVISWNGNFSELRVFVQELTAVGAWRTCDGQCQQYRTDGGVVVNFWPSTGTINFQGRRDAASVLRQKFLARAGDKAVVRTKRP
jgi:hypothetical protein